MLAAGEPLINPIDDSEGDQAIAVLEQDSPYGNYVAEFETAIDGMQDYLQKGRGLKESLLIAFGLVNGGIASYQSYKFGGDFTRRVLGPKEANAPSWLADGLAPTAGIAAFAANAMIPVISSDIATIASMKMMACIFMGIFNTMTCFRVPCLRKAAKKQEWYSAGAFFYSLAVVAGGILGSIANTEAAHDSVENEVFGFMLLVTIANAIVQLLQNTRSVMLLMSKDRSHLKRHRLNTLNQLLPEDKQKSPTEIHNRSFGSEKHTRMSAQVLLLGAGLLFAGLYNYTAAILPIEKDNPTWNPVLRHGAAAINFCVKSILLTRATTAQSRRIMQSSGPWCPKLIGFSLMGILGLLSVSGAAEYPKRYLFNNDNNLLSSIISIIIAEGACVMLNAGDMNDAGKIIYNFIVNKLILEKMCGRRPTVASRLGDNYEGFVNNAMAKVQGEDEGMVFHNKGYTQDQDGDALAVDVEAGVSATTDEVTVFEKPRSIWLTALDLQPAYKAPGADYAEMSEGVRYHPKEAAKPMLESCKKLSAIHNSMYEKRLADLGGPVSQDTRIAAMQFADEGMEALYSSHLQRLEREQAARANCCRR